MWFEQMHPGWQTALRAQRTLLDALWSQLSQIDGLAPERELVMAAFAQDPAKVRVLIVGQDPYPTPGVAVGRAFAVSAASAVPASLRNIFLELKSDLECDDESLPARDLMSWQDQGVMLLNRSLTTLQGQPGAHQGLGWETFTDAVISHLLRREVPLVLVLWGAQAQSVKKLLGREFNEAGDRLAVVESAHPSPLSARRGFFGSRPFSKVNQLLGQMGASPVEWLGE
ncbi:MAG: uracil-DNA glycosylase [Micrococcales bacterium]